MNLGGWATPKCLSERGPEADDPRSLSFYSSKPLAWRCGRRAACIFWPHVIARGDGWDGPLRKELDGRGRAKVKYIRTQAADRQLNLHYPELIFEIMRGKVPPLFLEVGCRNAIPTFLPGLLPAEASLWFCTNFKEASASALSPSYAEAACVSHGEARFPPWSGSPRSHILFRESCPSPDDGSTLCSLRAVHTLNIQAFQWKSVALACFSPGLFCRFPGLNQHQASNSLWTAI